RYREFRMPFLTSSEPVTYFPHGVRIGEARGWCVDLRLMAKDAWQARELTWRLFIRDFSAKYRQSLIGVAWQLITPIIAVAVFLFMAKSGILRIGDIAAVPYAVYAVLGIVFWQFFTSVITAAAGSIIAAGSMVVQINFPRIALVLSASLQAVIELAIKMMVVFAAFAAFRTQPSLLGIILLPLALVPVYLFSLGIGFFLSLAGCVLRDIQNILNYLLMLLMFLTPVVYPISSSGLIGRLNLYNPLNYFVNLPRDLVLTGASALWQGYLAASALAIAIALVGWRFFYLAQTKIAERI
ncbi:MAG: ABC transporter permease, partial [Planctomycetota bacterium]|nr:ABC transporter permease [Planctomycetota bacterium]